jgi:hypothetical protein
MVDIKQTARGLEEIVAWVSAVAALLDGILDLYTYVK